jgi:hypothetical protein
MGMVGTMIYPLDSLGADSLIAFLRAGCFEFSRWGLEGIARGSGARCRRMRV